MSTYRYKLPAVSDEGGLSRYLTEIKRFPMLTPEEEFMLAKRLQDEGDRDAAHRLVTSHLRLVAKIAMGYRHYGLPVSDLVAEGNMGLMKAVKKFEADRGFRLATYAMWWIKASINEYILNSWSLVKVGTVAAQKKLFFNLRRLKAKLGVYEEGDLSPEDVKTIATQLKVTEADVVMMNRRLAGPDASLNVPVGEDQSMDRMDLLMDEGDNQEEVYAAHEEQSLGNRLLNDALSTLTERERHIITARRLRSEPVTLEELGGEYGVSRERVRQIENRAFEKLQTAVRKAARALNDRQPHHGGVEPAMA
ncbi:RNA polymerase sigma factor RpoH [Rhodospirillum rubrum]|uniref:RNA polymerase sigma factor RpoH n=1 Tax=Rhodospirillum rubrum TaxID=1085 RepID=UPI001902CBAF|nr:RNA polymerase sigma factor RpoH [Rhodospirillum rubrum]MBK1664686.1 RNA polymerase sigma factor RpoH [Rhodospirillum rubrum]MBK1676558.1 RNA polymerase sigma factor RpoH [Rhodospirillum rubrum]